MTKVIGIRKPWSVGVRKKFGNKFDALTGGLYGEACFGTGGYGQAESNPTVPFYGVYQMRRCKEGFIPVQMRFYTPYNPRTEAQQANRQKIADAVVAWRSLTEEQKKAYNRIALGKNLSGYNLFISNYLLS